LQSYKLNLRISDWLGGAMEFYFCVAALTADVGGQS
jgi:hypothetical protein